MKKILIIDALNLFLRNFCVSPQMDENGKPVGGLVGSLRSTKFMIRETEPDRVFFVWDAPGGSRKRRGVMSEYKAGRKPRLNRQFDYDGAQESSENMHWQQEKLKQLLDMVGVTQLTIEDIEADDAMAYLVGLLDPMPKVLVSSDRDMWQLVSDTTTVYWPTKKVYITPANFSELAAVIPANFVIARAITGKGDSSDNIHGVKGLGMKTVLKLFPFLKERTVGLDEVFSHAEKNRETNRWYVTVLEHRELLLKNVALMQLTSPIISATNAGIIRRAALDSKPSFQFTNFMLTLAGSGIQLVDSDLVTTFRGLQKRYESARTA